MGNILESVANLLQICWKEARVKLKLLGKKSMGDDFSLDNDNKFDKMMLMNNIIKHIKMTMMLTLMAKDPFLFLCHKKTTL